MKKMFLVKHGLLPVIEAEKDILPNYVQFVMYTCERWDYDKKFLQVSFLLWIEMK